MAENIVVNDVTYNGVAAVAMETASGDTVLYYPDAVRFNPQELADEQKTQARENIGAVGVGNISLGIASDGLIYVFINGAPVGTGIQQGEVADVYGYIDENNHIVLRGVKNGGSYTFDFVRDDDSTIYGGAFEYDDNTYYSVTNNLTNCVNSNSDNQAIGGQSYTATITANDGYELSSVVVMMGGADVSASAVSGGSISIANVTGDIVITAVAEEAQVAEPVTVDIALTDGIRIGSDGGDRALAGFCATEMIDLRNINKPCTINLTKAKWCITSGDMTTVRVYAANANSDVLVAEPTTVGVGGEFFTVESDETGANVVVTVTSVDVGYIRFSGYWANANYSDSSSDFAYANTKATLTYTTTL